MRKDRFTRAFVIACLGLCGAFGLHEVTASQAEPSRREAGTEAGKTGWEYCAVISGSEVSKSGGKAFGNATICYFRQTDNQCENVAVEYKKTVGVGDWNDVSFNATSSVVAKLGQEGWEMVGEGNSGAFAMRSAVSALYFKRPKS